MNTAGQAGGASVISAARPLKSLGDSQGIVVLAGRATGDGGKSDGEGNVRPGALEISRRTPWAQDRKGCPVAKYRGQFQRPIGLGPGLVLGSFTLECRETFTSAVTCPKGTWKHGKEVNSTKNLIKKRGIF